MKYGHQLKYKSKYLLIAEIFTNLTFYSQSAKFVGLFGKWHIVYILIPLE